MNNSDKINMFKISHIGVLFCIFVLSLIFLMQSPLNLCSEYGNSGVDSSVFRTVATYMNEGYMPYKDTFDHKGPLLYIINFIGMFILDYKGIWCIEFIALFITFIYIYKIARLRLNKVISLLVVFATTSILHQYFEGGNLTEEYAMPFIAISLFVFLDYFLNSNITKTRLLVCGFSFAAVCLLRINMVSLWLSFGLIILIKCLINKEYKELWNYLLYFVIGAAILTIPVAVWLVMNNAFIDFINDYFIFNSMYVSDANTLIDKAKAAYYFMANPLIFISFIYLIIANINERGYLNTGYLLYFIATILLIAISGRIYAHYGMILIPMISYPSTKVFEYIKNNFKIKKCIFLAAIIFVISLYLSARGIKNVANMYENMNNESDLNIQVAKCVIENSREDDLITVFGNKNIIYLLSDRMPASKYSYQFPIGTVNPYIMDEYFEEINTKQPKIMVIYNELKRMSDFLEDNNYMLLASYSGVKIYKK